MPAPCPGPPPPSWAPDPSPTLLRGASSREEHKATFLGAYQDRGVCPKERAAATLPRCCGEPSSEEAMCSGLGPGLINSPR